MSELLPGYQATRLRAGLIDYLTTTFALVDSDAQAALRELLEDTIEGMFKGPYLRNTLWELGYSVDTFRQRRKGDFP